jgi:hypothetical protein
VAADSENTVALSFGRAQEARMQEPLACKPAPVGRKLGQAARTRVPLKRYRRTANFQMRPEVQSSFLDLHELL